jgi:hypothetical protein
MRRSQIKLHSFVSSNYYFVLARVLFPCSSNPFPRIIIHSPAIIEVPIQLISTITATPKPLVTLEVEAGKTKN